MGLGHYILGFILLTFSTRFQVLGLKIQEVFVPDFGLWNQKVTLRCTFEMESDPLLSVKWYKDEHEFFSYWPQRNPPIQQFTVTGVQLAPNSTIDRVVLSNLTLQSSGNYKCEVSADRPSYRTLSADGNLTIIVPPDPESPRLNGFLGKVLTGDTINGNCTSLRSHPAASLTFFINGQKMENPEVTEYRPIIGTWNKSGESIELSTSVLGLRIKVGDKYFRQGIIRILCIAKIGKLKDLTAEISIRHKNYPDDSYSTGYRSKSNSAEKRKGTFQEVKIGLSLLIILLLKLKSLELMG